MHRGAGAKEEEEEEEEEEERAKKRALGKEGQRRKDAVNSPAKSRIEGFGETCIPKLIRA